MKNSGEYLKSKNIHFSQQRLAIMDFLMKHRTHPTAEEIYSALYPQMPTLSRTTVYNTLRLFAENNAIQVINIEEKNARFDACTDAHAHFLCQHCGAIYDIDPDPSAHDTPTMAQANSHLKGFIVTTTQIYHKGVCPKCITHVK